MNAPEDWLLDRSDRRVELLEQLVEERNRELSITQEQAAAVYTYLLDLNNLIPGAVINASPDGIITRLNRGAHELLGYREFELAGQPLARVWPDCGATLEQLRSGARNMLRGEAEWLSRDGESVPVMMSAASQQAEGELISLAFVGLDLRERRRLEIELRLAQKLEALGQLSAGVAHEINTPMQFVGDNLYFLEDALQGMRPLMTFIPQLQAELEARGLTDLAERLAAVEQQADLGFVAERVPRAIERALDGVARVTRIVEAMKSFSHPANAHADVDINQGLRDTLTIARNAYKYIAEVECDLDEQLPKVHANGSDLNQVFLNLIVNAAHAIEEAGRPQGSGRITIRSRRDGEHVCIAIGDNGGGIPDAIRLRVFDPFFTTKAVGKGTGQGLSISRSIVVDRHGGQLDFETGGSGTTFQIRLPITAPAPASDAGPGGDT